MTKEIRKKFEEKIKNEEALCTAEMLSNHSYNCILLGMLDGLLIAGAITDFERTELYVKYKKTNKKTR